MKEYTRLVLKADNFSFSWTEMIEELHERDSSVQEVVP